MVNNSNSTWTTMMKGTTTWMQGINSHYSTINLVKEGNGVQRLFKK
jgi:hypothetical protein